MWFTPFEHRGHAKICLFIVHIPNRLTKKNIYPWNVVQIVSKKKKCILCTNVHIYHVLPINLHYTDPNSKLTHLYIFSTMRPVGSFLSFFFFKSDKWIWVVVLWFTEIIGFWAANYGRDCCTTGYRKTANHKLVIKMHKVRGSTASERNPVELVKMAFNIA